VSGSGARAAIGDLEAARQFVVDTARALDPESRYVSELLAVVDAARDVGDMEARLVAGCRGQRHSGADVFAAMSLADKLYANLITPETALFRFAEGELEAVEALLSGASGGRPLDVLIVPCSHGEEAFTVAAHLLGRGARFGIRAFDLQPTLIDEALTGRLTFGYPPEYLASPGYVGAEVLERIRFEVGDAFALPLDDADAFDLVMCRNFLGYFVPERAVELARGLAARVRGGGVIVVDGFCLGKFAQLASALEETGLRRKTGHPVFVRGLGA